jgi:hypothetical protein
MRSACSFGHVCYGWGAQAEDRATLESDLSADLGG